MRQLKLFLTLMTLMCFGVGQMWGTTYSGTVAKVSSNGDQTISKVAWTITSNNTSGLGQNVDGSKGAQIGSGKEPTTSLTFETSGISGTITNVTVNTSGASSVNATVGVTVGTAAFKYNNTNNTSASITSSAANYSFNGNASGTITISWSQTSSKALYVKSISVTYYPQTTITLNANGGAANQTAKYDYGETTPTSFTAVTRSNYTCTGYYTAASNGTKILNANGSPAGANITVNSKAYTDSNSKWAYDGATLTLYAQWQAAAVSCETNPTVGDIMNEVSSITATGATFSTSTGVSAGTNCSLEEVGFVYGKSANPTTSNTKATITDYTSGALNKSVTGLEPNTTYYVRAYAINGHGTTYSDEKSFSTPELPKYTVSFITGAGNSTQDAITEASANAGITLPAGPTTIKCASDGWEFAGWSATNVTSETTTAPTLLAANTKYEPSDNVTLYAVYTRLVGGSGGAPVGTTMYAENFSGFSADDVPSSTKTGTPTVYGGGSVTYTSQDNGTNKTKIYNEKTVGAAAPELLIGKSGGVFTIAGIPAGKASTLTLSYKRNNALTPTVTGTGVSIGSVSSKDGVYSATITCTNQATVFSLIFTAGSSNVRFDDVSVVVASTTTAGTAYYISSPDCCQELGSINGSVTMTQTTAALEWADLANVSSWAVQYKEHSAENWNTWNGEHGIADSKRSVTITSLTCGTAYDFKIAATAAAGYCDAEQVLENQSTTKWDITYTLSGTVAYSTGTAQGANACGEISATFSKNASYSFPDEITVTIGGVEATVDDDYLWDDSEGELYIDAAHVTGNVAVTIAGIAPATPSVTPDPTALSFTSVKKDADVPAAKDIALEGHNLTAALTVESSNTSLYQVSLKSGSLTPDGNKDASPVITVTPQAGITSTAGDKDATITISGGGLAADVEVNVTFNVQETYTVNWYVNGTDNLHLARTQTDIVGTDLTEIPSDFTGVSDCSDKVFMGWTEDDDYTHATDAPADLITSTTGMKITAANKNYYAVFADKEGEDSNSWDLVTDASSLQVNDIITFTSTCDYNASGTNYKDTVAYAGKQESANLGAVVPIGITNNKIRTVKDGSIRGIKLMEGSAEGTWKLYDLTDKYISGGKKELTYDENSGRDATIAIAASSPYAATVKFGSSDSVLSYNPNTNKGTYSLARFAHYSGVQKAIQIYKKTVTEAEYSNYVTVCPHVSRVTLSAAYSTTPANGEITFAKGGSAITSIATDGENSVTVDVVPDPETGYELTGVVLTSEDVNVGQGGASYSNGVITIPANEAGTLTATATFAQKNYSISVVSDPTSIGATLTGATSAAKYGVEQTISTDEPTGYIFGGWYIYDAEDTEKETDLSEEIFTGTYADQDLELSASFLMPDKDLVAEAYFDEIHDVAWALENTPSSGKSDKVYVKGLISKKESYQDNTITYWISDNGQHATGTVLEVYKGKGVDNANFTALDNLNIGDEVVIYGQLKTFSGTKEFDQGNYLYSRTAVALSALTIVGDASVTTYDVGDSFDKTGLSLTATYNTGYVQANYTGTTITSNYDAPTTFTAGVTSVTVSAEEGLISTSRDIEVTVSSAVLDHVVISADAQTEFWAKEQYKEPLLDAYLTDEPATVLHNVTGVSNTTGLDMSEPEDKSLMVTYTRKAGQEAEVEYNFTVKPVVVDEAHAHSVATAREIIDVDKTEGENLDLASEDTKTHVIGVVTSVNALTGANAGKYTIVIKDQTDADKVMTLYQVTLKSGITSVAQNDIIKAYGNLYYHSQSSKYEINTDGEVVAVVRTPNLTVADVAEMEVNITADLGVDDLTIDKDGSNGAITFSCSDAAVTIVNNKLRAAEAGDATVTATIAADGIYTSAETTFNVHVIAERTRYAIKMDANGGTGTDPVYAAQLEGATVDLPANDTYSKANSAFDAWVVTETESGDAVAVTDGHFTMPAAAVTIKATWNDVETCTISFRVSGSEVATADAPQTAAYSLAGVSHPTVEGFTWIGWSETEYDDETTTLPTTITSYTPAINEESKTLYGIYSQVVGSESNKHYVLDYTTDVADKSISYGTETDITATDGSEWVVMASKQQSMQINTGKDAYIKVPDCPANIVQIVLTCRSGATNAAAFSETSDGEALVTATGTTTQTLDLSEENVSAGYIIPSAGNCQITHIDVEYSGSVTYYTSSPVTRYTITYVKGDATNVTGLCEATRKAAGSITLCGAPTCADKNFAKWSDGTNLYAAGASYTLSEDVTFTATWTPKPKYTVTYTANGGTGTAPEVEEYMEGETVTVKENEYFTKPGFDYDGWLIVYNNGVSDQEITPENGEFEMVAYNVTIKAKWAEESKQKWAVVTDVADLKAGKKYIIAAAGYNVAMAGQNDNNRAETAVVKRNEGAQLKGTSSMQVITLEGTTGAWEFNTGAGYLYAASSSKNYLRTQETNDDEGKWTISITEAGVATITATGSNTNNKLRYNSSSKVFSCYASGQQAVALYKEIPMTVINDNVSNQDDVPDGGDMTIGKDKTWTVTEDKEVGDLYMEEGAIIANNDGENSAMVEADDLYFKAKTGKSNQIFDLSKITVVGSLYYDFQLCDGDLDPDYWYSISVPFDVDLNDGVYQVGGTTPLVNHSDFEVWEYDTQKRADTQSNGWKRSSDNMMHAGKAYLIGFNPGQPNIIRLKAAADWKTNLFSGSSMSVVSTAGSGDHDNWNGLANPTGRYINMFTKTAVFNNDTHNWDSYDPATYAFNFVVGTAFFVQSASAVTFGNTDMHGELRAPQREGNELAYAVRISKADATRFDNQIIVRASEDATNSYEQGHDMLTMNNATSNTSAMLWTVNYGGKRLAIEEAPLVNDQAVYDLRIYAPTTGTYSLSAAAKEGATLYVTYNGAIVWNLSLGDYEIDLARGTTTGYGLMLVAQPNQMPTGFDTSEGVGGDAVQKILLNGQLYILRDGKMFDAVGKEVK